MSETKAACEYLAMGSTASALQVLHGVSQAAKLYYNYTGSASCLNMSETATSSLGYVGWYYQVGWTRSADSQAVYFSHRGDILSDASSLRPAPRW